MNLLENEKIPDTCLYLKFLNKDLFKSVWDISEELNPVSIEQKWQSLYNQYVLYDEEPLCSDGFLIYILLSFRSNVEKQFAEYIIRHYINDVRHLNNCLKVDFKSSQTNSNMVNVKGIS